MKSFTLDHNCIIDLEEGRSAASYLEELKLLWSAGIIELAIVSVSASENQPSGQALSSHAEFRARLGRVGLADIRELYPIGIWDLGYWDHMLWASETTEKQVYDIKNILFPNVQHAPPADPSANSKWRNQMCDVLVAWAHGYYQLDYLVTSDRNFHVKKDMLSKYGIHRVVTPEDALSMARCN